MTMAAQPPRVPDRLLDLRASGQRHDTNVVATMLEHGIRRLLTFNAADFRRFARIIDSEPIPWTQHGYFVAGRWLARPKVGASMSRSGAVPRGPSGEARH